MGNTEFHKITKWLQLKQIEKEKKAKKHRGAKPGKRRQKMFMKGHSMETYGSYVYKVLKQVHPDLRISKKAMSVCDALCKDVEGRMQKEMRTLCGYAGIRTCSSRQAVAATRLVLPGELGKHAVQEGSKALAKMK